MNSLNVIVSRHQGAIEFLGREIHPGWHPPVREGDYLLWTPVGLEPGDPEYDAVYDRVRVVTGNATPEDVSGMIVWGNIPLDLASHAMEVRSIVYPPGKAPRGQEFGLKEMEAAGARTFRAICREVPEGKELPLILSLEDARQGGYCC